MQHPQHITAERGIHGVRSEKDVILTALLGQFSAAWTRGTRRISYGELSPSDNVRPVLCTSANVPFHQTNADIRSVSLCFYQLQLILLENTEDKRNALKSTVKSWRRLDTWTCFALAWVMKWQPPTRALESGPQVATVLGNTLPTIRKVLKDHLYNQYWYIISFLKIGYNTVFYI